MKKIPNLFLRDFGAGRAMLDQVTPGCEWVVAGEGIPTRKHDGTACLVRDGRLYKRFDAKKGKTAPPGFEACGEPDPVTGHHPGWVEVGEGTEDKWHREVRDRLVTTGSWPMPDGTYELCGPKVNNNPEGEAQHVLLRHGCETLEDVPRDLAGLREYLATHAIEGIVWHHPDGRMAKIKAKDFGLQWPRK